MLVETSMAPSLTSPLVLGRYALYDKIASGGMASVHLGRLLGPVGFARTVAVKRLHPGLAEDPEFVSMFMDEARLAARIHHPNVVPTLDVVAIDGELFLVMEYVRGESLARLLREARKKSEHIPAEIVTTLMAGVLHGLHAAHTATNENGEPLGIVHRDVSPQNILVGTDGIARVFDFGIAKAIGRIQTTREGQLKGKLAYMAPEQINGKVSPATDVYAAAVVLWEALTSRRLFEGENEAHVIDQVLRGCEEPPSAHAPGLPPALDALTLRGLSVDPAARFPTARDMARAIEEAMPIVAASKIGEYVEAMVKDRLTENSELVAAIERESAAQVTPPSLKDARTSAAEFGAARSTQKDSSPRAPDEVTTQLSSGSVSAAPRPAPGRRSRTWVIAIGLSAALVTLGVVLAAGPLRHSKSNPALAAPPPLAPGGAAAAPSGLATAAPATAAEVGTRAVDARGDAAPAASVAAPAPSASSAAHRAVRSKRRSPCDPPYYYNARGMRIFKTGCL